MRLYILSNTRFGIMGLVGESSGKENEAGTAIGSRVDITGEFRIQSHWEQRLNKFKCLSDLLFVRVTSIFSTDHR
jgi:hypothetical protein